MHFGFTPDQEAFRGRVREELGAGDIRAELDRLLADTGREPDIRPLYRALGRRRLLAANWPEEYGGQGATLTEASIVAEELARAGVPDTLHVNTVQIVGMFLLHAGSEQLKARYLPAVGEGRSFASVLYTEPEAGSDLAGLRTTAVRDGDDFVISGVKAYNLKSDITDVALCAARTGAADGRYQGITLFMVAMDAPGVRRETIAGIADEQFHRVVLDEVRVPAADVVGEVGQGWQLLTQALAVERTGLDYSLKAESWYAAVVAGGLEAAELERGGRFGAEVEAARLHTWWVLGQLDLGLDEADTTSAAVAKYVTSELAREVAAWANTLPPSAASPSLEAAYREAPGLTFSAGTSEMMLQIVAAGEGGGTGAASEAAEDTLTRHLRQAIRTRFASAAERKLGADAVHGPPAVDGTSCPSWPALAEIGAPGFEVPADAGGLGLGLPGSLVVCEELGRAALSGPYRATALTADVAGLCADGAHEAVLQGLSAGELTVTADVFGAAGRLAAQSADGGWTVSLRPVDTTHEPDTTHRLLLLETPDGLVPALLPTELPTDAAAVSGADATVDVFVPHTSALGRPSPAQWAELTARARIRQAAYLLGLAEGAHAAARAHTLRREQFGSVLHDFQGVSFALARAATRLETVRLAVRRAGELADEDRTAERAAVDALALAADAAAEVTATAVHVCGVRGLTAELPVQRHYRLARTETVRMGAPAGLFREAGRLRLSGRDDLELLTAPTGTP
ncbi:acyl-CoA dehydrogenase family protein [Streptomyces sp. NPDC046465]|uniref:acyl-CoA dehydrogenase family protein n=1 Tax=Streptomyces sp. NPDC046465 TaxID=3155810 RepID=UPI0033D57D79